LDGKIHIFTAETCSPDVIGISSMC